MTGTEHSTDKNGGGFSSGASPAPAAARGFDTWCLDNEGYGRSDKQRPINFDISSAINPA